MSWSNIPTRDIDVRLDNKSYDVFVKRPKQPRGKRITFESILTEKEYDLLNAVMKVCHDWVYVEELGAHFALAWDGKKQKHYALVDAALVDGSMAGDPGEVSNVDNKQEIVDQINKALKWNFTMSDLQTCL